MVENTEYTPRGIYRRLVNSGWDDYSTRVSIYSPPGSIDVDVEVGQMYKTCDLGVVEASRKFLLHCFGARVVEDGEKISESGCESCDYGSRYGVTFHVRGVTRNFGMNCDVDAEKVEPREAR